jgi:hypothetical protein
MKDLIYKIKPYICEKFFIETTDDFILQANPYPSDNNFDSRIGWFTNIVSMKINAPKSIRIMKSYDSYIIGFLSEPLED